MHAGSTLLVSILSFFFHWRDWLFFRISESRSHHRRHKYTHYVSCHRQHRIPVNFLRQYSSSPSSKYLPLRTSTDHSLYYFLNVQLYVVLRILAYTAAQEGVEWIIDNICVLFCIAYPPAASLRHIIRFCEYPSITISLFVPSRLMIHSPTHVPSSFWYPPILHSFIPECHYILEHVRRELTVLLFFFCFLILY